MARYDKELDRLDTLIKSFERISDKFPNPCYRLMLNKLKQERAEHVSKIGKK